MGNLKFGKIYTKDLDLIIQTAPTYNFPSKDVTIEHIPGRNGDLIIDNKCWQNVERTYSIASVFRPNTDFITNAEKLIEFLTANKGYQRLEDSYDPLVFRMATFKNGGSLSNYYDQATAINVTFVCKPQRYLKDGENELTFVGSSAILKNPTGFESLPKLTISGLVHSDNKVMMITVENENNVTSSITVSDLPTGDLILDSDLQTAYSNQNGDVNKYINLNGTEFPSLKSGSTEISVEKYTETNTVLPKYNTIISTTVGTSHSSCFALYKPYDSLVETKQKSVFVTSYNLLKQKVQEVYEAKAYANYCLEKAEHYTFISFNTVLKNNCQSYTFQGDYSNCPNWLSIQESGTNLIVKVGVLSNSTSFEGYNRQKAYFISSKDKTIRRLDVGETICTVSNSESCTITSYPAVNDSNAGLAINYSNYDKPTWLEFDIEYSNDHTIEKINYKNASLGYFYYKKTSGFTSKSEWHKYTTTNNVLDTVTWSTSKKAFMSTSGFSTSTTASFEYYYLDSIRQYDPTYKDVLDENGNVKKDANGNPIKEIENKVHFNVVADSDDLSTIHYTAKEAGYFRCNNADQTDKWRYYSVNDTISSVTGFVDAVKSSNIVYYLSSKPDYSGQDFPDWLNSTPVLTGSQGDCDVNPISIDFKVSQNGWYRYTYKINNDDTLYYTSWQYKAADSLLGIISPCTSSRGPNDECTIYMLEGTQSEFPIHTYTYTKDGKTINDIGFFYEDENGVQHEYSNNTPPTNWLNVTINDDGSGEKTLTFAAASAGSYKWDANTVWINKTSGSEIVISGGKDDTKIYYLSSMPSYPTYTKYNPVVNFNAQTGNPESVSYLAKVNGYFRSENNSNWKYYTIGEEIYNAKTSESITIYDLTEDQSVGNISIGVIPRWWSL